MNAAPHMSGPVMLSALLPPGTIGEKNAAIELTGLELDSRRIRQGNLFMACKGAGHDGRHYIADAVSRGAAAVLVEQDEKWNHPAVEGEVPVIPVPGLPRQMTHIAARFFGEPARAMRLVGITGTNGKTTTCHLTAQLFNAMGYRCGIIGTLGYGRTGSTLQQDAGVPSTTPDAVSLQRQLACLRTDDCDTVVMEVSSHGLDQYRVNIDDFAVAVFTNLTRDHLDYHGDMAHYAAAKRRLFTGPHLGAAVFNEDDAYSRETRSLLAAGVNCLSWSLGNRAADICCRELSFRQEGMALSLLTPWGEFSVETALLGSFNAGNLMAALATVLACESSRPEFDAARIVSCASSLQPVTGRMQKISGSWPFTVVVDYAHTPDGLEKALRAVREHCKGRVWVVFGCGGDRDRGKRPVMGAVAEANADMLVLTDDNPRSEISGDIIAEIRAGLTEDAAVHIEPDRRKAIAWALSNAAEGHIVLLAGKGHEDYQEIGGRKFPFNDAEIAGAFLKSRFGGSHD